MPIINHDQILTNIHSQRIDFSDELDIETLQIGIDSNEILLNASQIDFDNLDTVNQFLQQLQQLNQKIHQTFNRPFNVGVILSGELDFIKIQPFLKQIFSDVSLIVIDFAGFRDGRGYSFVKNLIHLPYYPNSLILRATGGVIADSLPFLQRTGFHQFEIDDTIFKADFFDHFDRIRHFYDGNNSQVLPMFANIN